MEFITFFSFFFFFMINTVSNSHEFNVFSNILENIYLLDSNFFFLLFFLNIFRFYLNLNFFSINIIIIGFYFFFNNFDYFFIYSILEDIKIVNKNLLNGLFNYHPILIYFNYSIMLFLFFYYTFLFNNFLFLKINNLKIKILLSWSFYINIFSMLLGCFWAFQEIGWNGWWSWDFIELISLFFFIYIFILYHNFKNFFYFFFNIFFFFIFFLFLFFFFMTRYSLISSIHSFIVSSNILNYIIYYAFFF